MFLNASFRSEPSFNGTFYCLRVGLGNAGVAGAKIDPVRVAERGWKEEPGRGQYARCVRPPS